MASRRALLKGAILAAPALAAIPALSLAQGQGEKITMYVFAGSQNIKGPDGKPHDTVVPANFVVHAGQPATLSVINYDEGPHTITAPDLKLDAVVKGGHERKDGTVDPVTTTFTFTAQKKGVYRWYCKLPCDAGHGYWAMTSSKQGSGQDGFMAGEIVVL